MLHILSALTLMMAPAAPDLPTCLGTARYAVNAPRLASERARMTLEQWRDTCRQARDANARRLSVVRVMRRTRTSPVGGYPSTQKLLALANSASDPDLIALYQHAAEDQMARESLSGSNPSLVQGLTPAARVLFDGLVSQDAIDADVQSRTWLDATIQRRGWFTIGRDGQNADDAAQLIVQHADADLDFKRRMIALLEPLIASGQARRATFPYLYDRWAIAAQVPQRFGLQGRCAAPGKWVAHTLAAPEHVDQWRADFGLQTPLADQVAALSKRCT